MIYFDMGDGLSPLREAVRLAVFCALLRERLGEWRRRRSKQEK